MKGAAVGVRVPLAVVPPAGIRVGMRVLVLHPPDRHCDRELMWGMGAVTFTELAGRTEVKFDSGSGGMFPHERVYGEPDDWKTVADALRTAGWTVEQPPDRGPAYDWRSPDGRSDKRYRSRSADVPPEQVLEDAVSRGDIRFTEGSAS